jgi:dipeptidase D
MINLDSECEGVLTAGCSGGVRTDITVPVAAETREGVTVTIALAGFSGGHSGVEIHEGHTNAIKALGRVLYALSERYDLSLISISGGGKDNAIPRDATATVLVADTETAEHLCADARAEAELLRAEPNVIAADKNFVCTAEMGEKISSSVAMTAESTAQVLAVVTLVRDGVLSMSAHVKGLVAYSRNLGIARTVTDTDGAPAEVHFAFATRSAVGSHLDDAERELALLAKTCTAGKGSAVHSARYPGWDYAPVSPLRDMWSAVSERLYGVAPAVEVIHAGLECGILSDKMPGMDIISIGPDMQDIHTPREKLSIPSVERTYRLVREVLRVLVS